MKIKTLLLLVIITIAYSSNIFSQQKDKKSTKKTEVEILSKTPKDAMILYIINGKYYLGDTINNLVMTMDHTQIKEIQLLKDDQEEKSDYIKKMREHSTKIKDVLVIKTDEDFKPSKK